MHKRSTDEDGSSTPVSIFDESVQAPPAVLCRNVVRIYAAEGIEVQALQGLNLRVEAGELVGLVGQSGSGKSTLLTILAGQDRPTAGTAIVHGHDLSALSRRERVHYRRHVIGFIWQQTERNLIGQLTATENILAVCATGTSAARRSRAHDLLQALGVESCAHQRPVQMSGGQQQRVAIAVALANQPAVLLADEPTGQLDEATSAEVLDALETVNRQFGVTTLIVTHDPTVADHVRRTIRIRDGRTSTETLRNLSEGAGVAQEFAIIDSAGRLQLPEEYVERFGLADKVRLSPTDDHIQVWPDAAPARRGRHASRDEGRSANPAEENQ